MTTNLSSTTDTTRQRLIEAAEEIFADKGYEATSIRRIIERAKANIAAVNYHFGDKEHLYVEAVRYAALDCCDQMTLEEWPHELAPISQLAYFIDRMIRGFFELPRPSAMQLVMRELVHPTSACSVWVEQFIRPMASQLMHLLRLLAPSDCSELRLWLIGQSIVSQCLYYRQNRAIAERLMGQEHFEQVNADVLSEHIRSFSLAALGVAPSVWTGLSS